MTEDPETQLVEDTPPLIAYRELVYQEAQRLYDFAVLLVEDRVLAIEIFRGALERSWTALRKRQLYMDIDEAVFWNVSREAAQRLLKIKELRGYQPPTTG